MKDFIENTKGEEVHISEYAQRLKLFYLYQVLHDKTDDENGLSIGQIKLKLEEQSPYLHAERKSLYKDIEALSFLDDFDIETRKSKITTYHAVNHGFQMPELKLLVDIIQSANFITEKKSKDLINHLKSLCSENEAKKLQSQVNISDRVKTTNEQIYYNIDKIYTAIIDGNKISFKYFEYNLELKKNYRRNGESYVVSPMALIWHNQNYYLVAVQADTLRHYRVDKMEKMEILTSQKRESTELFSYEDMAVYPSKVFSMYGGKCEKVEIKFANDLIGVVIDRFGNDITLHKKTKTSFNIDTEIEISPQFFGWLAGLGEKAVIVSPKNVKDEYKKHLTKILIAE